MASAQVTRQCDLAIGELAQDIVPVGDDLAADALGGAGDSDCGLADRPRRRCIGAGGRTEPAFPWNGGFRGVVAAALRHDLISCLPAGSLQVFCVGRPVYGWRASVNQALSITLFVLFSIFLARTRLRDLKGS